MRRILETVTGIVGDTVGLVLVAVAVIVLSVGSLFIATWAWVHVGSWFDHSPSYRDQQVCWVAASNDRPELHEGPRRDRPFSNTFEVPCP